MKAETVTIPERFDLKNDGYHSFESIPSPVILHDFKRIFVSIHRSLHMLAVASWKYRSIKKAWLVLKQVLDFRNKIFGFSYAPKIIRHGKKYYIHLYAPGFPSPLYTQYALSEMYRVQPLKIKPNRLSSAFIAITKKCPLACEHCFEWNELNKKETLTEAQLILITEKFVKMGISQFFFSGGEPLARFPALLNIIESVSQRADCWVYTSGFHLTSAKAHQLAAAGTTGIVVSLDHFEESEHNRFRGFDHAFYWARKAMQHATEAGLITALSCCVTKDFLTWENLMSYYELSKKLGASFVQFLEPKAVGHYAGKNVLLNQEEKKLLEKFYFHVLGNKSFHDFPIPVYPGYHDRNVSCLMAGDRSIYVNTDGDIQLCPFCQTTLGNMLDEDAEEKLDGTDLCSSTKRWKGQQLAFVSTKTNQL